MISKSTRNTVAVAGLILACLCGGCRVVQTTAQMPRRAVAVTGAKKQTNAINPVELQQELLRVVDEFAGRMAFSIDELRQGTNTIDRMVLLQWKLSSANEAVSIASAENTVGNLLDMLVMVTLIRTAIERHWLPNVYGDSAKPMLETCQETEKKLWQLATPLLKPREQEELRSAIQTWYEQHPRPEIALHVRAIGITSQIVRPRETSGSQQSTSVFSLLMIDPLSGLDPAARELAETRLFAERALFVSHWMPTLVRWQVELLAFHLSDTPEMKQFRNDSDRFTRSFEQASLTAARLPEVISEQREAGIRQVFEGLAQERTNILANLASEEKPLRELLGELRMTLVSGNEMANSANGAIKSLDTFIRGFNKGTNQAPRDTNAKPFEISEYGKSAADVAAAARDLNALVTSVNGTLPGIARLSEEVNGHIQGQVRHAFWLGTILVLVLLAGAVLAGITYRALIRKWFSGP